MAVNPQKSDWAGRGVDLCLAFICLGFLLYPLFLSAEAPPICLFYGLTGLDCPFCGLTHAMQALYSGDIARSLALYPLALPALLGAACGVVFFAVRAIFPGWAEPPEWLARHWFKAGLVLLAVNWGYCLLR